MTGHHTIPTREIDWPKVAGNFLTGLVAASLLQAAIDLLFWYGAHWYFLGAKRLLAGQFLHPLDSFMASLFGLTAFTAAASLLPALAVMAICRRRDIKGPTAYMTGGALTGVISVLASVSNPWASYVIVYAVPLALSGVASGYIFWRRGVRAVEIEHI